MAEVRAPMASPWDKSSGIRALAATPRPMGSPREINTQVLNTTVCASSEGTSNLPANRLLSSIGQDSKATTNAPLAMAKHILPKPSKSCQFFSIIIKAAFLELTPLLCVVSNEFEPPAFGADREVMVLSMDEGEVGNWAGGTLCVEGSVACWRSPMGDSSPILSAESLSVDVVRAGDATAVNLGGRLNSI